VNTQAIDVLALFKETGAYLSGHFLLTSGLHSAAYLQCAKVLQFPEHAARLGERLAAALQPLAGHVDVVVSPAMGGLIIGHEVARALGVRHIFTERGEDRKMLLRRGFSIRSGERAIVVEDVITTGVSTREVVDLLRAAGAEVAAASSIIDRSGGAADVGVPRTALETLTVETWDPGECPLCRQGIPAIKPGSRPS
jgi:orotate phosphoribosyltransferase